jgi:hypothetical protein
MFLATSERLIQQFQSTHLCAFIVIRRLARARRIRKPFQPRK